MCTSSVFAVFQDLFLDLNLLLETCVKRVERELALPLWEEISLPLKQVQRILRSVFYSSFLNYASIKRVEG